MEIKKLKTKKYVFGDYAETVERWSVWKEGVRVGTIKHHILDDWCLAPGEEGEWFDPFTFKKGTDKIIVEDYIIQRKDTLQEAIDEIKKRI